MKIEDLYPIRSIALDEGISFQYEKFNEDLYSINITYYEIGINDNSKFFITNLLVANYINQFLAESLKKECENLNNDDIYIDI